MIGGILVGALSESFSMTALVAVFLIIVLKRFYKKEKVKVWTIMALVFCMLGYFMMNMSPGTWNSKLDGGKGLASSFLDVLDKYTSKLMWLLVLWSVMLVVSFYLKCNRQAIIYSCLFMAVSVSVNFLHIVANAYPLRSMTAVVIFLIMADICLLSQLWGGRYEVFACIVCTLSIYFAVVEFFPGSYDILNIYRECRARENYIIEEREKGNLDLEVSILSGETKYSSLYTWKSLKAKETNDWRNIYMAKYYGVNTITGVKE